MDPESDRYVFFVSFAAAIAMPIFWLLLGVLWILGR